MRPAAETSAETSAEPSEEPSAETAQYLQLETGVLLFTDLDPGPSYNRDKVLECLRLQHSAAQLLRAGVGSVEAGLEVLVAYLQLTYTAVQGVPGSTRYSQLELSLITQGLSIDGPEIVIPCYETVEKALDQLRITLEPTAPAPPTFTVRVLDKSMLQPGQWVVKTDACALLWSELDSKEVDFTGVDCATDGPPLSALVCAIHMRAALLKAEMNMWIRAGNYQVPRWAQQLVKNPASGLTESFLRSAAQSAHAAPADTASDEHRSEPSATAADSHSAET